MAEPKTRPTDTDPEEFFEAVADEQRRADARAAAQLLEQVAGEPPVVWGTSILGFGEVASGASGTTWPVVALAPRKTELVLYLHTALEDAEFEHLGPHRRGKGCLYLKRLDDVDLGILRAIVSHSVKLSTT